MSKEDFGIFIVNHHAAPVTYFGMEDGRPVRSVVVFTAGADASAAAREQCRRAARNWLRYEIDQGRAEAYEGGPCRLKEVDWLAFLGVLLHIWQTGLATHVRNAMLYDPDQVDNSWTEELRTIERFLTHAKNIMRTTDYDLF
jgi:hypothetical protein